MISRDLNPQSCNHMVGLSGLAIPHLSHLSYQVWSEGSTINNKDTLSLRKLKGFRDYLLGTKAKG